MTGVHPAGRRPWPWSPDQVFDVVLTDLRMEPVGGMEVLAGVRGASPQTAVIILTAYGEVKTAVEALRQGAYQYLTKPINFQEVAHVVEQAAGGQALARENLALKTGRRAIGSRDPTWWAPRRPP